MRNLTPIRFLISLDDQGWKEDKFVKPHDKFSLQLCGFQFTPGLGICTICFVHVF